ncbi:putative Ubiquitin-conjugating enzyme E2 L3 [Hypsibius exemplaris]|uniref:E2 ubiquitin-conjugating enzyme n=1 Tax=Hypsibius exemplaris TaxID=2072580 RepID=A0A1W0X578_HYPEX|nr:putative Ubiquitin-conjugating enzyme E2 L3 [Hypsibius exemplaris]
MAAKRVNKELQDLKNSKMFPNIKVDEQNIFKWQVLLVPEHPPYNKGAFLVNIVIPDNYPFRPPKINFGTKIYHPNITEHGHVCHPIYGSQWSPSLRIEQVIQALLDLISTPEPNRQCCTCRADLIEEFTKDKEKFMKNAEEFTIKHAEKRPE